MRPKKSTYSNSLIVVVRDWDSEHQHAWLSCGNPRAQYGGAHVSVQYANGAGVALAKCWRNDPPRREDLHYTSVIRTSKLGITAGGLRPENMTEERQEHVLTADSPEECDTWDVWVAELETVRQTPAQRLERSRGPRTRLLLNDHPGHGRPVSLTILEEAMSKKRTAKSTILAASPMIHEPGILPSRIVIRDMGDQHVVHTEVFEPEKEPWYHQGDYFPKRRDPPITEASDLAALCKAWARFEERVRRSLRMDPSPVKRLAQASDIAETIIKTLLPDDEDDCRDLINDDYQLKSDIETFEHFTGKVIQPEDDLPILGDETEMEDIEWSL